MSTYSPAERQRHRQPPGSVVSLGFRAYLSHLCCSHALRTLFNLELNALAFSQAFEAVAYCGGVVDEHVAFPSVAGNKPVAFGIVKPLDRAGHTLAHLGLLLRLQRMVECLAQKLHSRRMVAPNSAVDQNRPDLRRLDGRLAQPEQYLLR